MDCSLRVNEKSEWGKPAAANILGWGSAIRGTLGVRGKPPFFKDEPPPKAGECPALQTLARNGQCSLQVLRLSLHARSLPVRTAPKDNRPLALPVLGYALTQEQVRLDPMHEEL